MSVIRPGDEDLHHSDQSHRWLRPDADPAEDAKVKAARDKAWRTRVSAHLDEHRLTGGGQPRRSEHARRR